MTMNNQEQAKNTTEKPAGMPASPTTNGNGFSNLDRRDFFRLSSVIAASAVASSMPSLQAMGLGNPEKTLPVFVQGQYRPELKEITNTNLTVRGTIPTKLSGRYLRNGHNPPPNLIKGFWFGGQGMIHGVRITGGRAEWYRNRFVQTPAIKGAPLFKKDHTIDLRASAAATSVYAHAGRILALQEVNLPFEISPDLKTIGAYDFDGALKTMMTAHPKIDPATGEMLFLSNSPIPPHLTYHVADKTGKLVHSEVIEGPGASIMHDFAITKNYVVWFDPSVTFNPKSKLPFAYTWNKDYQAKIGIMPRDRSKGGVQWINVPSFYFFHLSNAHEDGAGKVVIEGTNYDQAGWEHSSQWINSVADHPQFVVGGSQFTRWTVDTKKGTADVKQLDDLSMEFPTINYAGLTQPNRYTYAPIFPFGRMKNNAVGKYDTKTGTRTVREFKASQMPSEVYFVADPDGRGEDAGWLFTYVSDLSTKRSELWLLDATNILAPPTAVIEIPAWVPAGVHGSWIADSELKG